MAVSNRSLNASVFFLYAFIHMMSGAAMAARWSRSRRLQTGTQRPTSMGPTISAKPTGSYPPTDANSSYPSLMPSFSEERSYLSEAEFQHTLTVSEQRIMEETEEHLYEFIMQNLTLSIGFTFGEPLIDSNCSVTLTQAAIGRLLQETNDATTLPDDNSTYVETYLLVVSFRMLYTSRYGYDVTSYPVYLLDYINSHQDEVTEYLKSVINIGSSTYIVQSGLAYIFDDTYPPTLKPTNVPSSMPSETPSYVPTLSPSAMPSYFIPSDEIAIGFVVGIAIGSFLGGLLIVIGLKRIMQKRHETREIELAMCESKDNGNNVDFPLDGFDENGSHSNLFEAVPVAEDGKENSGIASSEDAPPKHALSSELINHARVPSMQSNISSQSEGGDSFSMQITRSGSRDQTSITSPTSPTSADCSLTTTRSKQASDMGTFMGANLLMRDDSFSSDSNDETLMQQREVDEFDQYKNEALEKLREEVEQSICDVDSMISLAMTRIFMEAEGTFLDLSWVGAEDPASIEASCYFEAFDWMKQNSLSGTTESFFQDMLYRIVQIVHRGLVRPSDGARLLHGCASILEMQLLRELPGTIVAVRGLRKTNDLAQGHHFLVKSFGVYGDIVDASISPKNKGFGFVRFVQPQSVTALMDEYGRSEIEIQDVSVSIVPVS